MSESQVVQKFPSSSPLAEELFPGLPCPQFAFPSVGRWPDVVYDALPIGELHERFYNIIQGKDLGVKIPTTAQEVLFDDGARIPVYNAIFEKTEGLIVKRGTAILWSDFESEVAKPKHFEVVILGVPGQIATEHQRKVVAEMLGLTEKDIVRVKVLA